MRNGSIFGMAPSSVPCPGRLSARGWPEVAGLPPYPSRRSQMSDTPPEESRKGRIVTFYSYKGGTGRTMALANVAWILAASGKRVLVADWDLESPGLHRFLAPFLDLAVGDAPGVIDLVRDYEWVAAASHEEERRRAYISAHARIQKYVIPVKRWTFTGEGSLEFLSAGRQNRDYLATLSALDWDNFYATLN